LKRRLHERPVMSRLLITMASSSGETMA